MEKSKPSSNQLDSIIEPTKIYVKSILSLINKLPVNAISHITGGGLLENLPRVLPNHLASKIDLNFMGSCQKSFSGCKLRAI